MPIRSEKLGGLTCHIVDELADGVKPRTVVVFCHGYGAPGTDLVPIGQMLLQKAKLSDSVQFLFPEAPYSLEDQGLSDGRAWWAIDMWRLQMAVATGSFRDLRNECPAQLPASRDMLTGLIRQWSEQTGVPINRFVLGGFSQGAMLTTDVTLHLDENPAGLVLLSGTVQNESVWKELAPKHKLLRVFQSHGTNDPILPFNAAGWLRDLLSQGGADVEFVPLPGGHEIPFDVLTRLGAFLRDTNGDGRTSI